MAFRKKYKNIVDYFEPDIMAIQECEEPERFQNIIDGQYEILWIGDNKNKGLSVFSNKSLQIKPLPIKHGNVRYMLPVEMNNGLKIIAFWAMDDKNDWIQRYIGQVWAGLSRYMERLDNKTIIIGDFNWNVIWDHSNSIPLGGKLTDVIDLLRKHQIESSYHYLRNEEFGEETEKTFYLYRKMDKNYHTDYIFMSIDILRHAKQFSIGEYGYWVNYSDHMPLFIEFYYEQPEKETFLANVVL